MLPSVFKMERRDSDDPQGAFAGPRRRVLLDLDTGVGACCSTSTPADTPVGCIGEIS
jgi:hypothetical protein